MLVLLQYIQSYLIDIFLLIARLFPIFMFIPFLNSRVLNSQLLKYIIIFYIALGIKPSITITGVLRETWAIVLISELIIGLVIGLLLATPFWIASAFGEFVDNQRGASIVRICVINRIVLYGLFFSYRWARCFNEYHKRELRCFSYWVY